MSYATRNENGDNMGNSFVRCPVDNKKRFAENWDKIFGNKLEEPVRAWEVPGLPHAVSCSCDSCCNGSIPGHSIELDRGEALAECGGQGVALNELRHVVAGATACKLDSEITGDCFDGGRADRD